MASCLIGLIQDGTASSPGFSWIENVWAWAEHQFNSLRDSIQCVKYLFPDSSEPRLTRLAQALLSETCCFHDGQNII